MAIELLDLLADEIGTATAGATLSGVLGFEDAELKRFPVRAEHQNRIYWLDGGVNTDLTEAMMKYTILGADNGAMTTLEIPLNATLGLDYSDPSVEYKFFARNYGAGGLTVNVEGGVTLTNYYELDLSTEGPMHAPYCFTSHAEDEWAVT
jgi:hypothetical protein